MDRVEAGARPSRSRPWARVAWFLVPVVVFIALLSVAVVRESTPEPGDDAPDFEARLLGQDENLALADLKGRPVFMNFWASWCGPCKDEALFLARAAERYRDRVAFVGVNIKDARSDALAFAEDEGLSYAHVRDEDGSIYDDYGLTGQPESFFIDANGVIVEHVAGPLFECDLLRLLDRIAAAA
ncbi:MAG TPA: TlpA disulfide reductase family protein [Actinomycetota bacterium]|nr:TlpA disulfide reductase family protein [Actinomycetota bacterium]